MTVTMPERKEGTASFEHGEQVDFRRASEHLASYESREVNEARDRAIAAYAAGGVNQAEIFLGKPEAGKQNEALEKALRCVKYVDGVSKNLVAVRQYEIDTHWDLEGEGSGRIGEAVRKVVSLITGNEDSSFKMPSYRNLKGTSERELLQKESAIGRELFGAVPDNIAREFFNLDDKTWIWYESTELANGQTQTMTTRYEIQDSGILKAQDGAQYSFIDGQELETFTTWVQHYYQRVMPAVYRRNAATGEKLTS